MFEICISTLIMALIMAGLMNVFLAVKRLSLHTRSRAQTIELGRMFLAPLQLQVRQDQWGDNCLTNTALCSAQTETLNSIPYAANYVTSDIYGALRKAKVTITWNEP